LRYLGRRQGTLAACLLAKAGARQQRRSSHSRVQPKATHRWRTVRHPCCRFRHIRVATRALIAAPGPRLASLCSAGRFGGENVETDLTPPRLHSHSRQRSAAGRLCGRRAGVSSHEAGRLQRLVRPGNRHPAHPAPPRPARQRKSPDVIGRTSTPGQGRTRLSFRRQTHRARTIRPRWRIGKRAQDSP
jgi:hypothetical protein